MSSSFLSVEAGHRLPRSVAGAAAICALGLSVLATSAQAAVVVGWDFENASNLQISNIGASSTGAGVSAATFNTGNNGVENFFGSIGKLSMTRFFGASNVPSLTFTLAAATSGVSLSFDHYHNHNPNFPTNPSYLFDVEWSVNGSAWADIGSDLVASAATDGQTLTIGGLSLSAGTTRIRWVGKGFVNNATDSNTEYFGLNNVTLVAPDNTVPVPGTVALVGLGLLALGLARKKTV